jgi:hypothetical protein
MYHLFKKDIFGNDVPFMSVSDEAVATRLMKDYKGIVSKVVEVPRSKSTIILM